jgi:hypothetical protein
MAEELEKQRIRNVVVDIACPGKQDVISPMSL